MSILPELFSTILDMSITASLVIIGVVLVRMFLRNVPKVFSYALWAVVLFRLLCPLSFTSAFSFLGLFHINPANDAGIMTSMPKPAPASTLPANLDNLEQAMNSFLQPTASIASSNPVSTAIEVFSIIWLLGIVLLLGYSVVSYIKVRKKLLPATLLKGNIYESDQIGTAFVCGFIQPRIYLPTGVGEADLPYILEHERTHIRRKDYLIKPLAFLVLILHWFNPLVWWSFSLMSRDMEMSCDESVLNRLGKGTKAAYSGSLLSLSVSRSAPLLAHPLAFGESNVKARIKNVLNYKKPRFWVIIIAALAVSLSVLAFTANPEKQAELDPIRSIAEEVIERDIANYELNPQVKIIDHKITRLELLKSFEDLADTPIDVYALEYRLLPDNLSKVVLAGGMQVDEDGWLKETCSMGSPLLLVSRNDQARELAGIVWTGESQELESAVKDFLAAKDLRRAETEKLVEENLSIIMSSPKEASNPFDYIQAHEQEYENIKKWGGEDSLQYMLAQFDQGNADGLRGVIMMQLCKELLGLRNNVTDDSLSPMEWYQALDIREETRLPDFQYEEQDPMEKLVYATEMEYYSAPHQGFTIVAPKIFGSYEEGQLLKVFVTTYSAKYRLYDKVLDQVGGGVVPAAITYKKDINGNYLLLDYEQSQDGAHWAPSVREYCRMPVSGQEIPGLADTIINHYSNYDDLRQLHFDNLYKHLSANGIKEATLTNPRGEILFSMSSPDRL